MRPGKARIISSDQLVAAPVLLWLVWFLLVPLAIEVVYSFLVKGPYGGVVWRFSLENYARAGDFIYLKIFWNSFKLAVATTALCLIVGYPTAYVMATVSARVRTMLLILAMLPFLSNFVLRAYAFKTLLGLDGPVVSLLVALGLLPEAMPLTNSNIAVWLGMATNYLPFMILPLYVSLDRFDFTLLEAARDLGASRWQILRRVLLPLSMPGIRAGVILVFMPALGEFVIPDMLGGARTMLMGNLITEQFLKVRDWPFGAALSILLMLVVGALIVMDWLVQRTRRLRWR